MLFRKKIVLGITGSIAAYKSALLARLLIKAGAEVRVVMTESSKDFITPLTLHTLTKNPVNSSFTVGQNGEWVNHVELGLWADMMVIAPASANTLGHCANGICESLLVAVYLSARCPVFFAPAMDVDMWHHPSTQHNVRTLKSYGNLIIAPNRGELASGLIGEGRMSEPEEIVDYLEAFDSKMRLLKGRNVLVSAGPTIEPIDDVRFISNHSSGKMGYSIANELASRGAKVTLVSGPVTNLKLRPEVKLIHVTTAEEMYNACLVGFGDADAAIMTAAVADFKPKNRVDGKIKKDDGMLKIDLEPSKDILVELGKQKKEKQILVGFALETTEGRSNAELKLKKKNLDFIVLNVLGENNKVFGSDSNKIEIGKQGGVWKSFETKSKTEIAVDIVDELSELLNHD
ncbi:MAG: bifunctional phosphopantothenoylcysteine decarboxylase/phosphopantothenate--cysteine ligase CoaBC [Bacteroidia bacterium]